MEALDFFVTHRRALHQIPELGFECEQTALYLEKQLQSWGYTTFRLAKTGVIAVKQGREKGAIGFRSDIDALPVTEETNLAFSSKTKGNMHACGHDGHMSILLRFAYETSLLPSFKKSLVFVFQPAEEGPGGAKVLIEENLIDRFSIEMMFGLHVYPNLKAGQLGLVDGPMMASSMEFIIDLNGKSAHAASPHESLDAMVAQAMLIQAYQSIPSRSVDPLDTCVLTVGTIHGGEAQNVIAKNIQLKGTVRAFSEDVFSVVEKRMIDIHEGIELSTGVKIKAQMNRTYPAVINDSSLYQDVKRLLDPSKVVLLRPMMFAEDFSYYQKAVPGFFVMMGIQTDTNGKYPLHHAMFDFDESVLKTGSDYFMTLANHFAQ